MTYTVLLRLDPAGACHVILRDDSEPLRGGEGVRYRLVASTDGHAEALRVIDLLQRRRPRACPRRTAGRTG